MKKITILFAMILSLTFNPVVSYAATVKYIITATQQIELIEGEKVKLSLPSKYKSVTWYSSDKKVATISKTGTVTAVSHGETTITAKSGSKKFKCIITVWTGDEEIVYEHDVSSGSSNDRYDKLTPDSMLE